MHSLLPRPLSHADGGGAAEPSVRLLGRRLELEVLERAAQHALAGSFELVQIESDEETEV